MELSFTSGYIQVSLNVLDFWTGKVACWCMGVRTWSVLKREERVCLISFYLIYLITYVLHFCLPLSVFTGWRLKTEGKKPNIMGKSGIQKAARRKKERYFPAVLWFLFLSRQTFLLYWWHVLLQCQHWYLLTTSCCLQVCCLLLFSRSIDAASCVCWRQLLGSYKE